MAQIAVILFVLLSVIYVFILVPKAISSIVSDLGLDRTRWLFVYLGFNVFYLIYLYYLLIGSDKRNEKIKLAVLIGIYLCIFYGAYLIDEFSSY